MTKLHIESSVFPALDDQLRQAQDCMVSAHRYLRMVAKEGLPPGIYRNEVDILDRHCDHMTTTIQHIRRFVSRSATAYEQVEAIKHKCRTYYYLPFHRLKLLRYACLGHGIHNVIGAF